MSKKGYKQTEEHKRKIGLANTGKHHTTETKIKLKGILEEMWKDENYKRHMSEIHKGNIHSEEQKIKIGLGSKNWHMNHPELVKKKGERISKSKIGHEVTEEARKKISGARVKQTFPTKDTQIELKIQDFLKTLHIEFVTHCYISKITNAYQCDILIPSTKTIIECDGCYWHGCPICNGNTHKLSKEQSEKDKQRTKELIEKDYNVLRLWEHDIKKMELNDFRIKLTLN